MHFFLKFIIVDMIILFVNKGRLHIAYISFLLYIYTSKAYFIFIYLDALREFLFDTKRLINNKILFLNHI
jgi:hypothetical protein